MKKVGILYHPLKEAARTLAEEIQAFLSSKGISVWLYSAWDWKKARDQANGTDMVLSIGGDGTILRAAQVVVPHQIPIAGINLGNLGFMTELSAAEAMDKLPDLISGKGWIDERSMLGVEGTPVDEKPGTPQVFCSLNDVVAARGEMARMVSIDASIDGQPLTTYRADGVIVATATGSTGYSLAAGGPILHPQAEEFLLLPMLAHLSLAHPLVLPSTAVVELRVSTLERAILSVDGHISLPLSSGVTLTVKHSPNKVRFLRIHAETSFYGSLEQKLKGKR